MPESTITEEEARDLWAKIKALDLSKPQRALLNAILKMAYETTTSSTSDDSLESGFEGSFELGEAALIMSYQDAASIVRSFSSSAALITRVSPGMITGVPQP